MINEPNTLFDNYNLEGISVSYTMKDFQRDYVKNYLGMLSPDEVLDRPSPDDRLKGLSPEEIKLYLKNLGENIEK
ncbi:hypothetical protein [Candidatus Electrothrix sp.]|uniref:hypothetical protein n=1 Tax=Candidatus Electrothrix sp. TaxID=2170559 RepID=UPI004056D17A